MGRKGKIAICWLLCSAVSPIIGHYLVVGFGFYMLRIPVGLGGAYYATLLTPALFVVGMGIYCVALAFKTQIEPVTFKGFVWFILIPLLLLVVWLLFTTSSESGHMFLKEIINYWERLES